MSDDDSLVEEILAMILRKDGSIRYDWTHENNLKDMLNPETWDEFNFDSIVELSNSEIPSIVPEPLGYKLQELISPTHDKLSQVINGVGIANNRYSSPFVEAIGITLLELQKAEYNFYESEIIVEDPEGGAVLLHDLMELELSCHKAGSNKKKQESCRHLYWKIWEFAWTRRIFIADDHTVDALENLYSRYKFLNTRNQSIKASISIGSRTEISEEEDGKLVG
ncbi:MAG: hypothetical protein HQL68_10140 [Magnetococcales bacterium]|nr:hypothetical protein [Magnetococcales bacterium]